MRAGLLANIILGESPHLKGLIRHFNLLVLNPAGKITGFNQQFIRNSGRTEKQLIHQSFSRLFDSEEGKADLLLAVRQAVKGLPGSVSFHLPESHTVFKGVIMPVYDSGTTPTNLIILTKEEISPLIEEDELEDFWNLASKMMEEVGISSGSEETLVQKMKNPRILLIEDKKGLVVKLFQNLIRSSKDNVMLCPNSDSALITGEEFQPHVVITTHDPVGQIPVKAVSDHLLSRSSSTTIFVSSVGNEIRIEDGWLDIHVKNQADSVRKILDLINQLYW